MAQCPVCGIRIPEPITPFCGQCGWDLGNDITLMTSIGPIPERIRDDYQRRVEIARRNWNERLQAIARQKELEKKLAEQEASEKQRALEYAFIKKCRESSDPVGGYREYLSKYPKGFYREEAERAITESERRRKEQEASERQRELERKAAEEEALAQQKRRERERKAAEQEALIRQRQQELDRKAAEQEALAQQRQRELDRRLAEQAESERRRQEALAQRIAEQEARIRLELQAEPEPVSEYVQPATVEVSKDSPDKRRKRRRFSIGGFFIAFILSFLVGMPITCVVGTLLEPSLNWGGGWWSILLIVALFIGFICARSD